MPRKVQTELLEGTSPYLLEGTSPCPRLMPTLCPTFSPGLAALPRLFTASLLLTVLMAPLTTHFLARNKRCVGWGQPQAYDSVYRCHALSLGRIPTCIIQLVSST